MAENKTKATDADVGGVLDALPQPQRDDCHALVALMRAATGSEPKIWGAGLVGFGDWHYAYKSGRTGHTFVVGFAPRKPAITLYMNSDFSADADLIAGLGKHTAGKGCLYIKRLSDVDLPTLKALIERAVARNQSV